MERACSDGHTGASPLLVLVVWCAYAHVAAAALIAESVDRTGYW